MRQRDQFRGRVIKVNISHSNESSRIVLPHGCKFLWFCSVHLFSQELKEKGFSSNIQTENEGLERLPQPMHFSLSCSFCIDFLSCTNPDLQSDLSLGIMRILTHDVLSTSTI